MKEEFVIYLGNYRYAGEPYAGIHGYGCERIGTAKTFGTRGEAEGFVSRHIGRREFPAICRVMKKADVTDVMPV